VVVPCPDINHCFPGVSCILTNDSRASYISCGNCPQGYVGDGIHCRTQCQGCNSTFEVCVGPEECERKCKPSCQNKGKCMRNGTCQCKSGFNAPDCSKKLDALGQVGTESRDAKMMKKKSCSKRPCLNGGTCMHFSGRCACLPGFKGRRCQRTLAKPTLGYLLPATSKIGKCQKKCQNGGVCSKLFENRCKCPPGFRGRYCQKPKCKGGCRNGGTCIDPDTCHCQPGFQGTNCRQVICDPPCQNGGVCRKSGRCKCLTGYKGAQCQMERRGKKRKRKLQTKLQTKQYYY